MNTPASLIDTNRKPGLTAKGDQRQYVTHCYHDRADESIDIITTSDENTLRLYREDSVGGPFPLKLQIVLKVTEKLGQQHIISWLPHGRSFMIHRPREFEEEVMGKFFKQTKLTSFRRQLNLYDFQRITHGRDAGSYYHELFLRGRPLLAKRMVRRKVKGTKIRASGSPDDEPNFYALPPMLPMSDNPTDPSYMMGMANHDPMYPGGGNYSSLPNFQGVIPNGSHQLLNHQSHLQQQHALVSAQSHLQQGSLYPGMMNPSGFNGMQTQQSYQGGMENVDYYNLASALQRNNLASSYGIPTNYPSYNHRDAALLDNMSRLNGAGRDPRLPQFNKTMLAPQSHFPGGVGMYPSNFSSGLSNQLSSGNEGQVSPSNTAQLLLGQINQGNEGKLSPSNTAQLLLGQMNQGNAQPTMESNNDDKQKAIEQLLLLQKDQSATPENPATDDSSSTKDTHSEVQDDDHVELPVVKEGQSSVLAL